MNVASQLINTIFIWHLRNDLYATTFRLCDVRRLSEHNFYIHFICSLNIVGTSRSYIGHGKKNAIQMKSSNQFLLTRVTVEQ